MESEAERANEWKDMKSAEKCWAYADARRGIHRQRKERQHQGAKQEARTDGLKRDSAKKSWRYYVGQREISQREQRQ